MAKNKDNLNKQTNQFNTEFATEVSAKNVKSGNQAVEKENK